MSELDKYSQLKLVAGKATPGPWWVDSHGMNMTSLPNLEVVFSHPANGDAVRNAETGNLSHWRNDWDASYIATANPKTILELISDFDAQRQRADTAEAAFEEGQANWVLCMETLRAAEQRIADLVGLLSRSKKAVDDVAENCEDQRDWQEANSMRALSLKIDAAFNPNPEAESHGRIPD